jgi:hypothetical protein
VYLNERQRLRVVASLAMGLALLSVTGCNRSEVRTYSAPKSDSTPPVMAAAEESAPATVHWKLPAGWQEQPASAMRVGSFAVAGADGQKADVSIIPLVGMGGSDLDNVNRWRGQVGLPPISQEEMAKASEAVSVAGDKALLFDIAGTPPGETKTTRLLAAVLHREGTAWFFKMTGDDKLVAQQKPAFVGFLKDITFEAAAAAAATASDLPPGHPPLTDNGNGVAVGAAAPVAAATEAAGKPAWTVPAGWQAEAPGSMQLAKFTTGAEGAQAEITVVSLPGSAGGMLANVNRWRGQIGLPPVTDAELPKLASPVAGADAGAFLVDLTNPEQKRRLIAAAVPHGGSTWFYKLSGDAAAAGRAKEAFVQFVQSVKYAP